jgi:hypothetical protein
MIIPYVPINESKRQEMQNLISQSNIVLQNYHSQVATRHGRLGFKTSNNKSLSKSKYLSEIKDSHKKNLESDVDLYGVTIPLADVKQILIVKNLEWEVLCSISGIISKIVNRKSRSLKDRTLSSEDLENECVKSAITSICSYTDADICFSTYFFNCIGRHISSLCNRTNHTSRLSKKAIVLRGKYIETKKSLLRASNFEEVVGLMNISDKEISLLQSVLCCGSIMSVEEKYGEIENYPVVENNNNDCSLSSVDVSSIELSELEKAVLEGFMQSSNKMGISSITKEIVNPKTGKPFTRMAASLAWKRVKEKIKTYRRAA